MVSRGKMASARAKGNQHRIQPFHFKRLLLREVIRYFLGLCLDYKRNAFDFGWNAIVATTGARMKNNRHSHCDCDVIIQRVRIAHHICGVRNNFLAFTVVHNSFLFFLFARPMCAPNQLRTLSI